VKWIFPSWEEGVKRLSLFAVVLYFSFQSETVYASEASDSLLNADRAWASQSHSIGFVAAYSKAMAPDARKLDGGAPPAIGRDAILALMARYPADLSLDWKPEEAVVAASGELGFTRGHFTATSHDSTGKLTTEHGKYLDVWRRQSDGGWRWIADIGTGGDGNAS
jgi:ketosteroid isomerase-like protein